MSIKSYGLCIKHIDDCIRAIAASEANVYFLQEDAVIIDDIRFLGCTLWTNSDQELTELMNDYIFIRDMTVDVCRKLYHNHVSWLTGELNKSYSKTVVITHHLPSAQSLSYNGRTDCFYYDDFEHLLDKVDYWICGHALVIKNYDWEVY